MSTTGLTDKELKAYTRKMIKSYFPTAEVNNRSVDPKLVVFALYLHRQAVEATALIKAMEELWKGAVDPNKLRSLAALRGMLKDVVKGAIKSYLKGEVMLMVKSAIRLKWRSTVTLYFNYGDDSAHPYHLIRQRA